MKKFILILVFIIAPILIGSYLIGSFYYKDKFPDNVFVNEVDIGGLTLLEADKKLGNAGLWKEIKIKSDTEDFLEIKAEDIDYKYMSAPNLPLIFQDERERNWLLAIFNESSYQTHIVSDYNKDTIKNMIGGIKELEKRVLSAKITYSSDVDSFVIEPHSYEIRLTNEQLLDLVVEGIEKLDNEVNIEKHILQPPILDDDKLLIAAKDKANEYLNMEIKYDFGDREELVDRPILKDFIVFDGRQLEIDPERVKEYVVKLARKYDTFSSKRNFKTTSGEVISTSGGSYGWLTHRTKTADALIEHIKNGQNVIIEPIYSYRALIRDTNDIGNSYVEIDLEKQMVYLYVDGQLKIKTETVTGNASKGQNTPPGVFPINYKETDAILVGEDYASPVKYWMPFNKNIGLHDADWRDTFGGDIYKDNGSNGCINLPPNTAKNIFDLVYPGMPVIVH